MLQFYFSDVYCDRRVPESVQKDKILWGECISGAMYTNDFVRLCHKVGFTDPRQLESNDIEITDPSLKGKCVFWLSCTNFNFMIDIVGNAKFFSVTFRLFKLPDLETKCEDYGQFAIYKGTIRGAGFFNGNSKIITICQVTNMLTLWMIIMCL